MDNSKKFTSISEYISLFPKETQAVLESIRDVIKTAAPDAVESISYQMPAFKYKGKPLAYFAAWKEHIGFYPTPSGTEAFSHEFSRYKAAKGSVQFPLNEHMPLDLIRKVVRFRVKDIDSS